MKAVFVDGTGFFSMTDCLGIIRPRLIGLYEALTKGVGKERRLIQPPVVSLSKDFERMRKPFHGAGFTTVLGDGGPGTDDEALIGQINRLDMNQVTELVILANDQDFVPVVRFKLTEAPYEKFVRVFWVGTPATWIEKTDPIGESLKALFAKKEFNFVELQSLKPHLVDAKVQYQNGEARVNPNVRVNLVLRSPSNMERRMLLHELDNLSLRFPLNYTLGEEK